MTPEERVKKCDAMFTAALEECGCVVYTALRVGKAESPLSEIAGLEIVIKIMAVTDDQKAQPTEG